MGLFSFAKGFRLPKAEFYVKIQPDTLEELKQQLSESGKNAVRFEVEDFG